MIAIDFEVLRQEEDPVAAFLRYTVGKSVALLARSARNVNQTLPCSATELMREVNGSGAAEKERFRDSIKDFFECNGTYFEVGNYFSPEAQEMMEINCMWPHTVN